LLIPGHAKKLEEMTLLVPLPTLFKAVLDAELTAKEKEGSG